MLDYLFLVSAIHTYTYRHTHTHTTQGNLYFVRQPELVFAKGITHILNLTRHSVPKEVRCSAYPLCVRALDPSPYLPIPALPAPFVSHITALQKMSLHGDCVEGHQHVSPLPIFYRIRLVTRKRELGCTTFFCRTMFATAG